MKPTMPQACRTLRGKFPLTTLEIGYGGVELAPVSEVVEAQIGYGVGPNGFEGNTKPLGAVMAGNRS